MMKKFQISNPKSQQNPKHQAPTGEGNKTWELEFGEGARSRARGVAAKLFCGFTMAAIMFVAIDAVTEEPLADFLRAETKPWTEWMEKKVDVHLDGLPLSEALDRPPFEKTNFTVNLSKGEPKVTVDLKQVTRRDALWQIANKYGLTMSVGRSPDGRPAFISIKNK